MRIGVRLAISALVLASILVSVGAVHGLWWRTAEANSRELASTINQQIVAAVEKEIAALGSLSACPTGRSRPPTSSATNIWR